MTPEDRARVIDALPAALRDVTDEAGFRRDICVLAAWVGQQVLRSYGISARAHAVRAVILNRQMREHVGDDLDRLFEPWTAELEEELDRRGAWSVLLGWEGRQRADRPRTPGRRFPGHVILETRNPDRLIDPTLDQAARPERGMPLEPAALEVPRDQLKRFGRGDGVAAFEDEDSGVLTVYGVVPGLDFRRGADWHDAETRELTGPLRGRLVAQVRGRLDRVLEKAAA